MAKPCAKDLFDASYFEWDLVVAMAGAFAACPSCRKTNDRDARYCISCGSVLSPVFCSSCGTINPEGLEQCLDCGKPIPKLGDIRWNPIVTVLQQTSAMSIEKQSIFEIPVATEPVSDQYQTRGILFKLREKLTG